MKHLAMVMAVCVGVVFSNPVWAGEDKATAMDVYDLVLKVHGVLSSRGEKGLEAFNDPKGEFVYGEFVYKDTYVFVQQCPEHVAAHPFALDKLKG
jgi:cytochrome c